MNNIKAVIFDLYGTLIYLKNETKPYANLFQAINLEGKDIALTMDFKDITSFVKRLNPDLVIDLSKFEKAIQTELMSTSLYPETIKVLEDLKEKNIILGLISNLASPYKKPFFNLGLDQYFDKVIFSCDVGLKKPNPEIYQRIIGELSINPSQALMVGDKIHADVNGPRKIGINSVHLDRVTNSQNSIFSLEGIVNYL